MKAVICPVCGGSGRVPNPNELDALESAAYEPIKPCHGCGGCGWVSVPD